MKRILCWLIGSHDWFWAEHRPVDYARCRRCRAYTTAYVIYLG